MPTSLLLCAAAAALQTASNGAASELAALTRLYDATAGASWTDNTNWLNASSPSPCAWVGISCNAAGEVEAVGLFELALTGTIPPQLSQLSALQHLNLAASASLSGTIPSSVALLSHLQFLDLRTTSISGTVPRGLSVAATLYLHETSLSGTLPTSVTQPSTLQQLDFEYTSLSGTLPPLTQLRALQRLALSQSALSGTISPSGLPLTSSALQYLGLSATALSGTLPTQLAQLSSLQSLFLFRTALSGSVPPALTRPSGGEGGSLRELYLHRTHLSGTVPPLGALRNLRSLSLSSAPLSGTLPLPPSTITELYTSRTSISGTISPSMGRLTRLKRLTLYQDLLSGSIPSQLAALNGSLEYCVLSMAQLHQAHRKDRLQRV